MTLKTTKEQCDRYWNMIGCNKRIMIEKAIFGDLIHDANRARELEWEVQRLDAGGKKAIDVSNSYLAQVCEKEKEIADLRARLEEQKALMARQTEARMYEAIGWCHAFCCSALDSGEDPRSIEVPVMLEKAVDQLGLSLNLSLPLQSRPW